MASNIKDIIAHLCKLLNLLCSTSLKPEHFRLAKFDKVEDNVISTLWDALFKVLYINSKNLEELKQKMVSLEYSRREFVDIENLIDHKSREVLLALGFAIARNLSQIIQLNIENSIFSKNYFLKSNAVKMSFSTNNLNTSSLNKMDLENYKLWLQGKALVNRRASEDYLEQISKIQKKLNQQFDIKLSEPLTLYELLALKSKKFVGPFVRDSREILQILSFYCEWLKKERHFWKWMGTVLEEQEKTRGDKNESLVIS